MKIKSITTICLLGGSVIYLLDLKFRKRINKIVLEEARQEEEKKFEYRLSLYQETYMEILKELEEREDRYIGSWEVLELLEDRVDLKMLQHFNS